MNLIGLEQSRGVKSAAKIPYINPRFSSVLHPSAKGQHGQDLRRFAVKSSSEIFSSEFNSSDINELGSQSSLGVRLISPIILVCFPVKYPNAVDSSGVIRNVKYPNAVDSSEAKSTLETLEDPGRKRIEDFRPVLLGKRWRIVSEVFRRTSDLYCG